MEAVKTGSENISNIYREIEIMRARLFLLSIVVVFSSVYCSAQEKAVPEPFLEGLRQQMKQLDTLQMNYSITSTTYPSNKEIRYEVSYIKNGDKYNMSEYAYKDDEQVQERRYVYDGIDVKFFELVKKINIKVGSVFPKSFNSSIGIENNIRQLAGFGIISPNYEKNIDQGVYKNMGKEIIDGHECTKILSIMLYLPQKDAYEYYWIEIKGDKYFLIKTVCLIEDDPDQLLYEKHYDYNYSDKYPIPRSIDYERFEIDNNGNRTPEYKKSIVVKDFEANAPISDSEFVYFFPEGTMVNTTSASVNPETLIDPNRASKATPLQYDTEANQPVIDNRTEFPIGGGCGAIFIPVYIQGKEYLFILDTGASITIFDASLKKLLGKPKRMLEVQTAGNPAVMQMFESPSIHIGPFILPQGSEIGCVDLNMFKMIEGRELSGILGMDFLRKHAIKIDFDNGLVSFVEEDKANLFDFEQELEITFNTKNIPQIKGHISKQIEIDFVIDSGNISAGSLNKTICDKLIEEQNVKTLKSVMITASGSQETREIRVDSLTISNLEYKDLIFGESSYDNLGLEFLDRHTVIMDFPNKKMYLKKGEQFNRKDESGMSGLSLIFNSGILTVYSTFKSSPAEKVDIKAGDIIVQIDGKEANSYNMKQLKQLFRSGDGNKVKLKIDRDGELKEITIVLEKEI